MSVAGVKRRLRSAYLVGGQSNGSPTKIHSRRQGTAFDNIASRITGVMALKLDQLESDPAALAKVNLKDLAVASGISTEKALLLAGNATRITETRSDKARYEATIEAFIKEMAEQHGQVI